MVTSIGIVDVEFDRPDLLPNVAAVNQYSTETRLAAWQMLLKKIAPISPVIGLGWANYYFYTPLFPISGYFVKFNSHTQYVDILGQIGIVGLPCFCWAKVADGRVGWCLRGRVGDSFALGYVYACLARVVGALAAGFLGVWILPFVYNIGLAGFRASLLAWLFLGGLVAIKQMVKQQNADQPSTNH